MYNEAQCSFIMYCIDWEYYCNENTDEKQKESKPNIHKRNWDS